MRQLTGDSIQVGTFGVLIFAAVFVDKLLGLAKEMLVAYTYGVSKTLDVFNIAGAFPSLVLLFLTSAFVSAFVPLYIGWKNEASAELADTRALSVLYGNLGLFCLLTAGLYFLVPSLYPLFGYGFTEEQNQLGIHILRVLLVLLLIEGFGITLFGVLQANKQFVYFSIAPIFINISLILCIALLGGPLGVQAMVYGLIVGKTCKVVFAWAVLKAHRFRFRPVRIDPATLKTYYLLALPMIGSEMIASSSFFIDQIMATQLDTGSVSSLTYAHRIYTIPNQLIILVISRVMLPYLSQYAAVGDDDNLRSSLINTLVFVGVASFLATGWFVLFSGEMTSIIFQRGAFDAQATAVTSSCLLYYGFGIFFQAYTVINGSFLVALRNTKPLIIFATIASGLNILLNLILMRFMGVSGIALSTSLTLMIISVISFWVLRRILRFTKDRDLFRNLFLILATTIFWCLAFRVGLQFLDTSFLGLHIQLGLSASLFAACYLTTLWRFRTRELESCFLLFHQVAMVARNRIMRRR